MYKGRSRDAPLYRFAVTGMAAIKFPVWHRDEGHVWECKNLTLSQFRW
jgi:hypothetical protein